MSALLGPLLAGALLAGPPIPDAVVERRVREILTDERYYFCRKDNDYEPLVDDLRWCELAAETNFRGCEGFAEVCGREAALPARSLGGAGEGRRGGDERAREREAHFNPRAERERERPERRERELPDLGGFARVLMWGLIFALIFGVIYALTKNLVRGDDDRELDLDRDRDVGPDASESLIAARAAARRVVETDVGRLLAQAEDAARARDHERAINKVYAALLRRLEGEQLVSVERWKTNGDYVRALRPRAQLQTEVRTVLSEVEAVQFGARRASAETYASVRAKVQTILARATLAALVGLGLGGQLACDGDEAEQAQAIAGLGAGPSGHRALAELLIEFEIDARHRARSLDQLTAGTAALVVVEGSALEPEHWDRLLDWVEAGGVLVLADARDAPARVGVAHGSAFDQSVLARFVSGPNEWQLDLVAPPGGVIAIEDGHEGDYEALLARPAWGLDDEVFEQFASVVETEDDELALVPYLVRRELGDGQLFVFAEPDLLTNAGLPLGQNAAFLVDMFRTPEVAEVEFVNAYTGVGADNPMQSVRNAKLGALFVQILLALAVLYAAVGLPFTRLRAPAGQRRRAFAEHVETLGQRYAQAKAARHVATRYCSWALDRLRARLLPGSSRGLRPLAEALAARTGRDEAELMRVLVQAHSLREASEGRGGPEDLALMRALAELLDQTGGVH